MPLQSSMRISLLSWLNCVTFLAPFGSMLRSWCAEAVAVARELHAVSQALAQVVHEIETGSARAVAHAPHWG